MPHSLKYRQEKIQEIHKDTPRRKFIMEVASWHPFTFYKHEGKISKFPGDTKLNLVSTQEFELLREKFIHQGFERNAGTGVLETIEKLFYTTPHSRLIQYPQMSENAEYSDMCGGVKNIYLSRLVVDSEDVVCSMAVKGNCNNIYHSLGVWKSSSIIYNSMFITNSQNVFYSQSIHDSYSIYGSTNLIGCSYCIGCHDLSNQTYMVNNKNVSPEIFESQLHQRKSNPKSTNTNKVLDTRNIEDVTNTKIVFGLKTGNNVVLTGGRGTVMKENFYNTFAAGGRNNFYGCYYPASSEHLYCCASVVASSLCFYSINLEACSYCFGCIGLKNKQFCIFNTQYSKHEWYDKVNQLFTQMEIEGTLGSFFPGSMNPFYFNDTAAYLIDGSFTKEEIEEAGYLRRDEEIKVDIPEWMDVVDIKDLGEYEGFDSDGNRTIDPGILKKVIRDKSGNSYRIIKMEYDFLVKHGLPLPRKDRIKRLKSHFVL